MSDSDDTDVLLLIPPDLFVVPSSESDESELHVGTACGSKAPGVVSELIEHMQSLETRISAIESKDNSLDVSLLNNSLDSQTRTTYYSPFKNKQLQSKNKFSVSQSSSLQNTPAKIQKSSSVPSTPSSYQPSNHTNFTRSDIRLGQLANSSPNTNITSNPRNQHDYLTSLSEPSMLQSSSRSSRHLHADAVSFKEESHLTIPFGFNASKNDSCLKLNEQLHLSLSTLDLPQKLGPLRPEGKLVKDMELSEVDEFLHEMEATNLELARRISNATSQYRRDPVQNCQNIKATGTELPQHQESPVRRLDFHSIRREARNPNPSYLVSDDKNEEKFADISLPYEDSLPLDDTEKMISEFKSWQPISPGLPENGGHSIECKDDKNVPAEINVQSEIQSSILQCKDLTVEQSLHNIDAGVTAVSTETMHTQSRPGFTSIGTALSSINEITKSNSSIHSKQSDINLDDIPQMYRKSHIDTYFQNTINEVHTIPSFKNTSHAATNTEPYLRKSQRLLTLSDFWDSNTVKSQEEMFRIKLEEEKFRREHCEHLIQELQKRLLEQQEKVAVAIRVDNEKNVVISQFQSAWAKLKNRWHVLETEHRDLQNTLKNLTEKHNLEVAEFQVQIKRCEGELSKALDLAAGYKEKSDSMIKEKLDLLRSHADELENYKSLVQEAEARYEQMKGEYNKLSEKNQQVEETLKTVQQELNREWLRSGEVRNEMAVIHKALDACEAELTVLRQEKENLQLKLKEEMSRNSILEQNKSSLLATIDDAKKAEKTAKEETKSVLEQQEKIRTELREVYQKQLDEVVKTKLQEFQAQLDTAESVFQSELETRQRAIAECAARKIKSVIDKHQLEINLLEEKHKEEKRLFEIQLAQAVQKTSILEGHLNTHRTTKTQLAEQLHSVMQKQWQQALHIISGSNMENLTPIQRVNAEKFIDARNSRRCESLGNCCAKEYAEPMRLESRSTVTHNFTNVQPRDEQDESLITISPEVTPLTSRKESKDDLRRYIKMILDMQQPRDKFTKTDLIESTSSPTPISREVPRKHYTKKELSIMSEDSIAWQPTSEL
ncbi:interaptin isoform X2 [Cephus cinctus]|uniref:Interaptin isoform X2 n=1 Tax=Cephus cinctus TaxID=211228 RepID=A0AAJ7CAW3_CEPCN|nr:interaptin isoform X2 [Cephus cinctus]